MDPRFSRARAAELAATLAASGATYAKRAAKIARRGMRRVAVRLRPGGATIVHHPGYHAPLTAVVDPRRADKILAHLVREGWLSASQIVVPEALPLDALARVHGLDHLEKLDDPRVVGRALGEGDPLPIAAAAALVLSQRWATAGTVRATEIALSQRRTVVSLGGGFHHAGKDGAAGFCLFNDIAVAIAAARARGFRGRVLVIDLDLHHGDGTRSLFAEDDSVLTCSIHATSWDERPARASIDVALGPAVSDATYLRVLDDVLVDAFLKGKPDLVIYVAGVDVAADDRLGGWRLSPDAVLARDRRVLIRSRGTPTVMVLAGGYGPDAWRHTARTLSWLLGGDDAPIASAAERDLDRMRRIAATIARSELARQGQHAPENFDITAEDLFGQLVKKQPVAGLLGLYTAYGVEVALERYGLLAHLAKRGYPRVRVELDLEAAAGQAVTVRDDAPPGDVLVELVVQELRSVPPLRLLSIEWLMMQDPRALPAKDRPLLPSQRHPGLGALPLLIGILVMACERLGLDGITFLPAHYHVAAQARGLLEFLDPADEARFAALAGVVGSYPLATSAAMLAADRVVRADTGEPVHWKPARMVLPVSEALRARVRSPDYDREVEAAAQQLQLLPPPGHPGPQGDAYTQ